MTDEIIKLQPTTSVHIYKTAEDNPVTVRLRGDSYEIAWDDDQVIIKTELSELRVPTHTLELLVINPAASQAITVDLNYD